MTDNITDQDRRAAREWAKDWMGKKDRWKSDRSVTSARVILALVDAPTLTLAEKIRSIPGETHHDEQIIRECAAHAEQIEEERDHLRADLDDACDKLTTSKDKCLDLISEVEHLTAERDVRPAADLPDPADVPAGQPWEVVAADPAKKIGGGITKHNAVAFRMTDRWVVSRNGYQTPLVVPDHCVSLVRRLVPAPRTITTREDLDALPEATVIRDVDGMVCEHVNLGTRGMQWLAVGIDETYPVQNPTLPATVLWTPEVEA